MVEGVVKEDVLSSGGVVSSLGALQSHPSAEKEGPNEAGTVRGAGGGVPRRVAKDANSNVQQDKDPSA
jgi:hypothetical protein